MRQELSPTRWGDVSAPYRRFCRRRNPWRSANSLRTSMGITEGWRRPKAAGTQKERHAFQRVFLFGGDTQTRTGGGAFAELCLTTWLCRLMDNRSKNLLLLSFVGAGDEARTRYLHLGKVALYQMSYTCISVCHSMHTATQCFLLC